MHEIKSLVSVINEFLANSSQEIPVFHMVALKLQQVLAKKDYSISEVTQLIVADAALSSQVLRVANSSFYAGLSKVANIKDAVVRLGAAEVANIAMLATQQDLHRTHNEAFNRITQTLWKHSLGCAVGSRW